jgi:response regulator RpfG family c-di-GMP phosphodiesterase
VNSEDVSILIVDDESSIRVLLAGFLGDRWQCTTASSADEAIQLLGNSAFDLIVTDINMPGRSGLDLCKNVRQNYPAVDVIVISALSDINHAIQAMRSGAVDYITKPFSLDQVNKAIEAALAKRAVTRRNREQAETLEARICQDTDSLGTAHHSIDAVQDRLYSTCRAAIQSLARTLEARDLETRGHSDRVVAYSLRIGAAMNLNCNELTALEQGALLHDIGKIGVRDSVLLKQGPLTHEEWLVMKDHVSLGLKIISNIDFLAPARFVIGQHHEKFDGSGYPNGLAGQAIHIAARVFAVADAYDAITSDRPYRAALPHAEACREISNHTGTQFDPAVVDAFLRIPATDWPEIRQRIELKSEQEPPASKSDIHSFVVSLQCPVELSGKLDPLGY